MEMERWMVDGSDGRSAASGSVCNKSLIYSPLRPPPMFVNKKCDYCSHPMIYKCMLIHPKIQKKCRNINV